jgi:ATP-dependent DNA helicase
MGNGILILTVVLYLVKHVNGLHLQNLVMQLRKVCNHPFLFDWPIDPQTNTYVLNNDLAAQSGKVLLLDRLLTALFDRGHKVLVFSQMTKMLDILEDWATELKHWPICRLDGSVSQEVRRQRIDAFNDPDSSIKLFLLSTRAGGLGINLTAADTVVIFDSDWVCNGNNYGPERTWTHIFSHAFAEPSNGSSGTG